jgi:hypothetical protein
MSEELLVTEGGAKRKRRMGKEYDQSTLHTCMETS